MSSHDIVSKGFRRLNRLLHKTFGEVEERYLHEYGDGKVRTRVERSPRVHVHWQNLNEKRGDTLGPPYEGRCWFRLNHSSDYAKTKKRPRRPETFMLSWHLWRPHKLLGAGIEAHPGSDSDILLNANLWPVSFWLGVEGVGHLFNDWWMKRYRYSGREVGFSLSYDKDGALPSLHLRFDGWVDNMEWDSRTPKWRHFSTDIFDHVFGPTKHMEALLVPKKAVKIPMPEGSYDGTFELKERRISRKYWPLTETFTTAHVEVDVGIPHEGKGENSWDCGEDATYGLSCPATGEADAISKVVKSVLESRRKYNGNINAKYPPPEERVVAVLARREAAAVERMAMKAAGNPDGSIEVSCE